MRLRARAAGPEPTARRWIDRRGDVTLEDHALPRSLDERIRDRNRRKQRTRVRVARTPVELLAGRNLHDLAEVHDRDAVGDVFHDREVVRDEEVGEVELALQPLEQVDDLRLNRNVTGRDRLVTHDEARIDRQRARDADALALAAREFVRIPIDKTGVQADHVEQLADPFSPRGPAGQVMDVERLAHDVAHRLPWIERRIWVLKDHRHVTAMSPQRRAPLVGDVLALELNRSGCGIQQANDGAAQRRLAAARFADKAQRLALL